MASLNSDQMLESMLLDLDLASRSSSPRPVLTGNSKSSNVQINLEKKENEMETIDIGLNSLSDKQPKKNLKSMLGISKPRSNSSDQTRPLNIPILNTRSSSNNLNEPSNLLANSLPSTPYFNNKTRPSTLPPKPKLEEKKHLQQFQEMMILANKKQHLKLNELKKKELIKEKILQQSELIWNKEILSNWNSNKLKLKNLSEGMKLGLPTKLREKIWLKCLPQTRPNMDHDTFNFVLNRFDSPPKPYKEITLRNLKLIQAEIINILPDLNLFHFEHGPLFLPLLNVIKAYCSLSPNELYTCRIGSMASILILNLDESTAFRGLDFLLNRPIFKAIIYHNDQQPSWLLAFDLAFKFRLPKLYHHFHSIQLHTEMFLVSWISTFYLSILPLDTVHILMDFYLLNLSSSLLNPIIPEWVILHMAITILTKHEAFLYGSLDETLQYLAKPCELIGDDVIMGLMDGKSKLGSQCEDKIKELNKE